MRASPNRLVATILGAVYLVVGVAGFVVSSGVGFVSTAGKLLARLLREYVVGDADGEFALTVERLDHLIVVWVGVRATTRIDDARYAKAIQLAHEVERRVALKIGRAHV